MSESFFDPHTSLGFMTITANRLLSAALRRKMRDAGVDLTAEQWGILVLLWNAGEATQEELARVACVDKSSMSRVLAVMERRGLVVRRADPADARRKIIRPSETAGKLRRRSRDAARNVLAQAASGLGAEECAACLRVLAAVKENLGKAAP